MLTATLRVHLLARGTQSGAGCGSAVIVACMHIGVLNRWWCVGAGLAQAPLGMTCRRSGVQSPAVRYALRAVTEVVHCTHA